MRPLLTLAILLVAGCTAPAPPDEPDEPALRMLALDGRWAFDGARAAALLAGIGAPAPAGALVTGEAFGARVHDFLGLDEAAARTLDTPAPARGEAVASRASGLSEGETVRLRSHAWPAPYVATYFEMERLASCATHPASKLCALEPERENEARLRLRVDAGARDAALLPDLVELGPGGRPAYWNGSFESPQGERFPLQAVAPLEGPLVTGELGAPMREGEWTLRFVLEANGRVAPAAAAGIVRVREPGYLWFDDRLQLVEGPTQQARAVLANATPTSIEARVTRVVDALPLGADVLLAMDDARALAATTDVSGLLVELTRAQERRLDAARGPDGMTLALRTRPLPEPATERPAAPGGALVFAAPHDVDVGALPRVDGAGAPGLALATRPPVGEPARMDGAPLSPALLLLAHADGAVPWALPPGGRWTETAPALDNLSRSRTLALASPDLVSTAYATARVETGALNATRTVVAIGGVVGGPHDALWTSAALVAGLGSPVSPRVVVPVEPGADRDEVARRAMAAWAPAGLALDR